MTGENRTEKEENRGWQAVSKARKTDRLKAQDLIPMLFNEFMELHGDRLYGDDPAILAGTAFFEGTPVTVIAQCKGKNLEENQKMHFGMPYPEGYRKAQRLCRQAEKFHRPVITIVDTPGAFPGKEAEMRGQADAISCCLSQFSALKVPVFCIVLSEGGSGGALALSAGDRLYMFENAVYSILSPEGFASILYKDETRFKEAANAMKLTSHDLLDFGLIDSIIPEPDHLTVETAWKCADSLRTLLRQDLEQLSRLAPERLVRSRRKKLMMKGKAPWLA